MHRSIELRYKNSQIDGIEFAVIFGQKVVKDNVGSHGSRSFIIGTQFRHYYFHRFIGIRKMVDKTM